MHLDLAGARAGLGSKPDEPIPSIKKTNSRLKYEKQGLLVTLEVEGGPELGVVGMWTVEDLLLVRPMRAAFGIPMCD